MLVNVRAAYVGHSKKNQRRLKAYLCLQNPHPSFPEPALEYFGPLEVVFAGLGRHGMADHSGGQVVEQPGLGPGVDLWFG